MKKLSKMLIPLLAAIMLLGNVASARQWDFGGQTVVLALHDRKEQQEATWFEDPENRAHLQWVEEQFNVKIEFAGWDLWNQVEVMMAEILTGETTADVYGIRHTDGFRLAALGALLPLNDVLDDEYWDTHKHGHAGPQWSELSGKYYSFIGGGGGDAIVWNKSLFEREGLPNLYELWQNDQWTFAAFEDIALKATKDTDGDGEIDQWGFAYRGAYGPFSLVQWAYANGATMTKNVNGREVFNADAPEFLEALRMMQDLYNKGALLNERWPRHPFRQGNLAMMQHFSYLFPNFMNPDDQLFMEDEFSWVPFPRGNNVDRHVNAGSSWNWRTLPVTTRFDPRALVELVTALESLSSRYVDLEEMQNRELESFIVNRAPDYETVETQIWLSDPVNIVPIKYMTEPFAPGFEDALSQIIFENRSPASVMAEIKPAIQLQLDELLNR